LDKTELLDIVRMVADYQFGYNVGLKLFPNETVIEVSRRTGRPRYILLNGKLLATLRSNDGMLALTLEGGERLAEIIEWPRFRVVVHESYIDKVLKMKIVKVNWVKEVDELLYPNEEVLICTSDKKVIGVGKTQVSGQTIISSRRGTAVKVRDVKKQIE